MKKTMSGGYTYSQALTPDITSVSPARGGTGGGVLLTVGGTGFGYVPSFNKLIYKHIWSKPQFQNGQKKSI